MATLTSYTPTSFTYGSAANFTVNGSGIPSSPGVNLSETMASGITWTVNNSTVVVSPDGSTLTFAATPTAQNGGNCNGTLQLSLMILTPCMPVQQSVSYS